MLQLLHNFSLSLNNFNLSVYPRATWCDYRCSILLLMFTFAQVFNLDYFLVHLDGIPFNQLSWQDSRELQNYHLRQRFEDEGWAEVQIQRHQDLHVAVHWMRVNQCNIIFCKFNLGHSKCYLWMRRGVFSNLAIGQFQNFLYYYGSCKENKRWP